MQRLFSTFPNGLPGVGLVLLRVATAVPLVRAGLLTASSPAPVIVDVVTAAAALLLLLGVWTPIVGGVVAVAEFRLALLHISDPATFFHFGVLAAALAMIGPGAYSVDARLFGRKHLEFPPQ